ncbi:hypothetical protein N656DRAFT_562815 [Canariomyces notabilis]|uniref:Uncharacterized protein n=1 Tax=Canariomyces notabilis TaxID=2074819 RepID=A0AAN6QGY8_9PEZI|nr:hypothetical protein N656DRAFT_562815 [Canariomyces arenarius]
MLRVADRVHVRLSRSQGPSWHWLHQRLMYLHTLIYILRTWFPECTRQPKGNEGKLLICAKETVFLKAKAGREARCHTPYPECHHQPQSLPAAAFGNAVGTQPCRTIHSNKWLGEKSLRAAHHRRVPSSRFPGLWVSETTSLLDWPMAMGCSQATVPQGKLWLIPLPIFDQAMCSPTLPFPFPPLAWVAIGSEALALQVSYGIARDKAPACINCLPVHILGCGATSLLAVYVYGIDLVL